MNILFFQNCISPHQMPYIKELPLMEGVEDVVVLSPVEDLDERKEMGWNIEGSNNSLVQVVVSPTDEEVKELFSKYEMEKKETWCLFSGINAFPDVARWFKFSLGYKVRRGIITEPPYIYDHPLWQHAIRFAIQDLKYVKYIDKFFLMGDEYVNYYKFWSKRWKVIPFKYCTEWRERQTEVPSTGKLKVLYVGALSHRKNVPVLIDAISKLSVESQNALELGIVGDGEEREKLENKAKQNEIVTPVKFYGSKPMEEIPSIMEQYDVLVLPSLHDGWGAVINEALTLGLYAICSENCGAKYLLKSLDNGQVFKNNDCDDLKGKLQYCINNCGKIRERVADRILWAKDNISGKSVAQYFLENLMK